jgi:purine-nucleoside phosphorylase
MWNKVQKTVSYLKNIVSETPVYGIILGSGLGDLVDEVKITHTIPYEDIPNFPVSTVKGHQGALVFGYIGDVYIMMLQGRFHYYEGYDMQEVTFPVRVMKQLGIERMVVSNASGGVNPDYVVGDVMLIKDHVNQFPEHPLRGHNEERFGPRFVNMSEPYDRKMIAKAKEIAKSAGIDVKEGVYLGLQGPTFETLAEYIMVKNLGADAVGMSTVPEVIVAKHMDMQCFGVSIITDIGSEDEIGEINHQEVLAAANAATPKVSMLVRELIKQY